METQSHDLHGMVPDKSPVVLLLVDVINDLEFDGAERLERFIEPMARRTQELKRRAKKAGIAVVYANDNYGRWQSDYNPLVERCLQDNTRGKLLVSLLKPDDDDYFVIKPKHSAFYETSLDVLMKYLGARTILLAGVAGNICVLFTANDVYMRDYTLYVPEDCCASNEAEDNETALQMMRMILKADTRPSTELDLARMVQDAAKPK